MDLSFTQLMDLYDAGRTIRFHTTTDYSNTTPQRVNEHAYGVVLIGGYLAEKEGVLNASLLQALLVHDAAEMRTADVPAPTKWRNPALKEALIIAEETEERELGISELFASLSKTELSVLKWADALELYVYSRRRVMHGVFAYATVAENIDQHMLRVLRVDYALESAIQLHHELRR